MYTRIYIYIVRTHIRPKYCECTRTPTIRIEQSKKISSSFGHWAHIYTHIFSSGFIRLPISFFTFIGLSRLALPVVFAKWPNHSLQTAAHPGIIILYIWYRRKSRVQNKAIQMMEIYGQIPNGGLRGMYRRTVTEHVTTTYKDCRYIYMCSFAEMPVSNFQLTLCSVTDCTRYSTVVTNL